MFELKKLNLESNEISAIDSSGFHGLENLEELIFFGNKLTKNELSYMQSFKNLSFLDLQSNQIDENDLNGLKKLFKNLEILI